MKIQTFSIVAGSAACDAKCPFCVSKMTPEMAVEDGEINYDNFDIACKLAKQSGATTAMITGKGEPTLYPGQIKYYLDRLHRNEIPILELQTNGIRMANGKLDDQLGDWFAYGLRWIVLSAVDCEQEQNREIFTPNDKYLDLPGLVGKLHDVGFSVRLSITMLKDIVDGPDDIKRLVEFCRANRVEQLSVRPVKLPDRTRNQEIYDWTKTRVLEDHDIYKIRMLLERDATKLMTLMHGGIVYDYQGQNICLTDCLTRTPNLEDLRHVIYCPDGHVRYDWQYSGSILL